MQIPSLTNVCMPASFFDAANYGDKVPNENGMEIITPWMIFGKGNEGKMARRSTKFQRQWDSR